MSTKAFVYAITQDVDGVVERYEAIIATEVDGTERPLHDLLNLFSVYIGKSTSLLFWGFVSQEGFGHSEPILPDYPPQEPADISGVFSGDEEDAEGPVSE